MSYQLTVDEPILLEYLSEFGYTPRVKIWRAVADGDYQAIPTLVEDFFQSTRGLFEHYGLNWAKECTLDLFSQASCVATLSGIDGWDVRKFKVLYTPLIKNALTIDSLLQLQICFLRDLAFAMHERKILARFSQPVQRMLEFIRKNVYERITVTSIAEHMHFSESSVYHRLKGETGYTPQDIVQKAKIAEAKRLLRTGRPMLEVSTRLSYCSQSYFITIFKKEVGVSPAEWVRLQRAS